MTARALLAMVPHLACLAVLLVAADGRILLQGGTRIDNMLAYIDYVTFDCGDPANVTGRCVNAKTNLCDTGGVTCTADSAGTPVAKFSDILSCVLTTKSCYTTRPGSDEPIHGVDPESLSIWLEYAQKCTNSKYEAAAAQGIASPSICGDLSGRHCSRPDVRCDESGIAFYDSTNPSSKIVALVGNEEAETVSLP